MGGGGGLGGDILGNNNKHFNIHGKKNEGTKAMET
jgi:hypothetical protein